MSILCIGQLVADIVVRPVPGLPPPSRTELVEQIQLLSGGCAANTAAVLAKLGVDTALAAVIGQDALGDAALADLKTSGVRVDAVVRDAAAPTAAAIVLVSETGERSFFYRNGGNEQMSGDHVADSLLQSARIIHVGGALKLLSLDLADLMRRAKAFGCVTSLDTDWDVHGNWLRRLEGALPNINYLMTNQDEASMLTGQEDPRHAALDLLARGPEAVVVKRGECGAMLATAQRFTDYPAYPVQVVDTTCAGDCFAAGVLCGISRGMSLDESMRLGNACGALCATAISHRAITSLQQVQHLIEGRSR